MSDELTMIAMMVIAGGAALFVAWPLMFGSVRPDDFLETGSAGDGLKQQPILGASNVAPIDNIGSKVDSPSRASSEAVDSFETRADLHVELEIEAFRRHSRQENKQDNTGGQ